MKQQIPHVQFTDLCASLLVELYEKGVKREEIEEAMRGMPLVSKTRTVKRGRRVRKGRQWEEDGES